LKPITRLGGVIGALALVSTACGGGSTHTAAPSAAPTSSPTTMMAMPAYAMSYHTAFTAPADGIKVTENQLSVGVNVTGYTDSCDWAGRPPRQSFGHYHLLLDKALVNMYCTLNATVSLQNVKPGMHKLTVLPALNDHAEVEENGQTINFDYEPTSPLAELTDLPSSGPPSIKILSPKPGTTVSGTFDVTVLITNFKPDCDLYGKPDLAGYGHWHLNYDTASGAMMGMGGMQGMSCTTTLHASTVGLKTGETHTLIALLVDNGHAPLNPAVQDKVDVTIG